MRSTLGSFIVKIVVVVALVTGSLAGGAGGALAATRSAKITLDKVRPVAAGAMYAVSGRLVNTGARNDKTIILQSRVAGKWRTAAVQRRQDDGAFRFRLKAPTSGQRTLRAVVQRGGRTLAVSAARTVSVLPSARVKAAPARPGEAPPASNFGLSAGSQTMQNFLSYVLGDVQRYWDRVWAQYGLAAPTFKYYWPVQGEAFYHGCRSKTRAPGTYVEDRAAHYCPANDYIVINTAMATDVWRGAGDFAVAFVVAHEYAHNLQHELRLFNSGLPTRSTELHADCWAGIWANSAYYQGILDAGDIEEAVLLAGRFGDAGGPEDHGTPAQRQTAFKTGYNSGQPTACNVYLQRA